MLELFLKLQPLFNIILGAIAAWICWSLRQIAQEAVAKVAARTTKTETDITALKAHVARLEGEIEDLPSKADLARVEEQIKSVGSQVGAAVAGISRMESYFIEEGVKARSTR